MLINLNLMQLIILILLNPTITLMILLLIILMNLTIIVLITLNLINDHVGQGACEGRA